MVRLGKGSEGRGNLIDIPLTENTTRLLTNEWHRKTGGREVPVKKTLTPYLHKVNVASRR